MSTPDQQIILKIQSGQNLSIASFPNSPSSTFGRIALSAVLINLILLISVPLTYCQNNVNSHDNKKMELKLKEKSGFPDNFPLQLGGEYGLGFREGKYGKDKFMFWQVFVDFNLYDKTAFLKLEYGEVRNTKDSEDKGGYGSLGLNVKVMNENQHKIYMHAATGFFPFFLILSSKYLYSFNKYLGVSFGVRYILTGDYYLGVMAGIQFFTN